MKRETEMINETEKKERLSKEGGTRQRAEEPDETRGQIRGKTSTKPSVGS